MHGRSRQGLDSPPATRKGFQEAISDLLGEDMPERAKGRQRRSWGRSYRLVGADFEVVSRKVAAPGDLGSHCRHCGEAFSDAMVDELWVSEDYATTCESCGGQSGWLDSSVFGGPPYEVRVEFEDTVFLDDPASVVGATWFHSTQLDGDWHADVSAAGVFVHLGSEAAARDRHRTQTLTQKTRSPSRLYEVRFKPGVKVDPRVFADQNDWVELVNDESMPVDASPYPYSHHSVNRYVNEWEAPGRVSLLVAPNLFEVVSVKVLQ